MIDIHSHIIYGIDDGCKCIEDSVKTVEKLKSIGFDKIVLTPHYISGSKYCSDNKEKKEKISKLIKLLNKKNINIDLLLGNEVYINDKIIELISENKVMTINNTKYILIELSMHDEINNIYNYLYELKIKGYIPIIVHPERYIYFQKKYNKVNELHDDGILFQCNYGSLIGIYGKESKKLIKYMLKNNLVTFMATDIHSPDSNLISDFNKIIKKLKKITDDKTYMTITYDNPLKVLNNEDIN